MTKQFAKIIALSALLATAIIPAACAPLEEEAREVTAERLARPAFMVERKLSANDVDFQLWERVHEKYAAADVYIEGDGLTMARNSVISGDPSPRNPVALHLASRDNAKNVIYIGRPCQYKESQDESKCSQKLWTTRRFSPEVIAAYNVALDEIKKRNDITEFNLIGYDGGANIAAALAAERKDVVSLRTVAGILTPSMVYDATKEPIDADSVVAKNIATQLVNVPQHHFIGAGDNYVTPGVYHSFRQAMGDSECVHYSFVQDADHERGWVEKWPELLKQSVACPAPESTAVEEVFVPTTPLPPVPHSIEKP